jgi:hypothetical protein
VSSKSRTLKFKKLLDEAESDNALLNDVAAGNA